MRFDLHYAELRWVVGGAVAGVFLLAASVEACGPPPIGWQGAGRMQTLPSPQPEAGAPTTSDDSGSDPDTGTTGNEDTGSPDTGADDADDSGSDATTDAEEDSADDSGTPDKDAGHDASSDKDGGKDGA